MDIDKAVKITTALCLQFEGLYLRPYLCPAGVPTIGVGATFYENGVKVKLTDPPINKDRAITLLDNTIRNEFLPAVLKLCQNLTTESQLAAITDFAFNLGINALKNSTLRKRLNAGDIEGAKKEILKWNRAGGKVLSGLQKRRTAEAALM